MIEDKLQFGRIDYRGRKGVLPERSAAQIFQETISGDRAMKQIELTQNQVTIVDDSDFEQLSKHKWQAWWNKCTRSFYAIRNGRKADGKRIKVSMAREILGLKRGDKLQADHRDHNTLDNRRANLRIVTCQQNHFNRKSPKGYYWHKPSTNNA